MRSDAGNNEGLRWLEFNHFFHGVARYYWVYRQRTKYLLLFEVAVTSKVVEMEVEISGCQ